MSPILAEPQFQALLESAPDAMVIVDASGQIVMVNSQAEQLFGYPRDQLLGQRVDMLLPAPLRRLHSQHRAGYVADPHSRPMGSGLDLVAQRADGSVFPVEISLSPLQGAGGLLVTSVIRDITERKRAAEALERQVQQRTAHLNALLQFSQELLGARGLDVVLQRALRQSMALVAEASSGAIYLYDPDDGQLALRASAGFHQLPSLRLAVTVGTLGRAFRLQQPQLTSSIEELLQLVPELAEEGPDRLRLLFDQEQLPSGTLAWPFIAHRQPIGVLLLIRPTGAGPFAAGALTTLEGLANLTAAAIWGDQRVHEAASMSSRLADLEQQQRAMKERLSSAEVAMLQAARLAAVGQLAASIAHEINNPLYAARNALYLVEQDLPAAAHDMPYLTIARNELSRIAAVIERMRDFYRPTRGDLSSHDLNHVLEETLALTSLNMRHTAINVIFTPDTSLPAVVCDIDQIRQVCLNLILNAIEAMPEGGTLTVRTSAGPTVALIEIQDTGIGIAESIRERLFEPFFTSKPQGTGLGLSISAHIVTQHGGQLAVESVEGAGATFRVALPYQAMPGA